MKFKILLKQYKLYIILLLTCVSCLMLDENKEIHPIEKQRQKENLRTPKNAIIFCDMTTSLDSLSIKNQAKLARQLIIGLPWNSKITAFPINNSTFSSSFFNQQIPKFPDKNSKNELNDLKIRRKRIAYTLENEVLKRYNNQKPNSINEYQSCIISSFETIYGLVKSNKNNENTHIVFFSDMIEQCLVSSAGSIYMCTKDRKPNKKDILEQIEKKYNPNFNLKNLIGNRISIVVTSDKKEENRCLLDKDLKEVWQKIFEKVGYSKEDFDLFHFNQLLPDLD